MIMTRIFACGFALALGGLARAQWTERANVAWTGTQGGGDCSRVSVSANGRFVVFDCDDSNFVQGDSNAVLDVFLRDRVLGTNELVSVGPLGVQGDDYSIDAKISSDGRFVVFQSGATNLVSGDTNGCADIFVRDLENGTTERVSVGSGGVQGNDHSFTCSISADGRFVAFGSLASNLVAGDGNGSQDVFVRDRFLQVTERVSVNSLGIGGAGISDAPSISANGMIVAFESEVNLESPDTNGTFDIFVRDRFIGATVRVSKTAGLGTAGNGPSMDPRITPDAGYVTFESWATNLVSGDSNSAADVFVCTRTGANMERVSLSSAGAQGDSASFAGSISADARFVGFSSVATNLVAGDTNGTYDIFLRDRELGVTELLSPGTFGFSADGPSYECALNADGRCAAFVSYATNLVAGDTNLATDAFVRERGNDPHVTSMCHPGYGLVMGCPCANPPSGTGRGCNNSSNTGGAILSTTGLASLSADTLTLVTSGELPNVQSLVLQGTSPIHTGFMLNQGVRCFGGYIRRLYWKHSINGSIFAPDFALSEPSVSVRSAQTGVTIHPGDSLYYAVWYRDPVWPCTAGPANVTQTLEVVWVP